MITLAWNPAASPKSWAPVVFRKNSHEPPEREALQAWHDRYVLSDVAIVARVRVWCLSWLFEWRSALVVVRPETLIGGDARHSLRTSLRAAGSASRGKTTKSLFMVDPVENGLQLGLGLYRLSSGITHLATAWWRPSR